MTRQDFIDAGMCPPPAVTTPSHLQDEDFTYSSVYVAGRYCKLKRHVSNSKWVIGGKRITEDSVEELIGDFMPAVFGNTAHKFSSAGREDADVLMLGTGRPFYIGTR